MSDKVRPLTSLRFLGFLVIFAGHLGYLKELPAYAHTFDTVLSRIYASVTLFFVLSGFGLAHKYSHAHSFSLFTFLHKRIAKIYPLHAITLLLSFTIPWVREAPQIPEKFFATALLIQSFIPDRAFNYANNAVSWFFSDIVFIYLVFALVLWILTQSLSRPVKLFLCTGLAVLLLVMQHGITTRALAPSHWAFYISPIIRLIDVGAGIVLYFVYQRTKSSFAHIGKKLGTVMELFALAVLIISWFISFSLPIEVQYSLWFIPPLCFFLYTLALQKGLLATLLSHPLLVALGNRSFVYLVIHLLLVIWATLFLGYLSPTYPLLVAASSLVLTILIGSLIYFFTG